MPKTDNMPVRANKAHARELARELFLATNKTAKEIAELVGVTEQTLARWRRDDGWDKVKGASSLTADRLMANLHNAAFVLSEQHPLDVDKLAKLANSIEKLKPGKLSLTNILQSLTALNNFILNRGDLGLARELKEIQSQFIDSYVKEQ